MAFNNQPWFVFDEVKCCLVSLFEARAADAEAEGEEEVSVFTGQRLKKKMQVYSGSKSSSLPAMMSLYQQCIRALQNNIDCMFDYFQIQDNHFIGLCTLLCVFLYYFILLLFSAV